MKAKEKIDITQFQFKNKSNEELIKKPGDLNGYDFMICDLQNCDVFILDHLAQVLIDNLSQIIIHLV
jgi:protein XRP2